LSLTDRQEKIRRLLAEQGRLTVQKLASRLRVASMTIRRDLTELEAAGVLTRTHGGCVLHSPFVSEMSFPFKQRLRQAQKTAIALATVRLLKRGQALYLDTGTTALQVARALPPELELRVFTNNLRVALELLGRRGMRVVVYGGVLSGRSPDLAGEIALAQLRQFRVDVAIVGGDALDVARGEFYGADTETAMVSRVAQQQADRVLVVMDSSKIGKRGLAVAGRLAAGTTLITDDEIDRASRAALRATGATVVFAPVHAGACAAMNGPGSHNMEQEQKE
jgi:DeoR/GlpR family transcriptional regulator of sugar metabolism